VKEAVMKRGSVALAVLVVLCGAPFVACAQDGEPSLPPFVVVSQFFKIHFSHDMGFTEASLKAKQSWLTKDLYKKLLAELRKPVPKDEVPDVDGDPFTNSQEYPKSFKVTHSSVKGDTALVTVEFLWPDDKTSVQVALLRTADGWLIDDIIYGKDDTLRKLLK
jgi:hypothetical protein